MSQEILRRPEQTESPSQQKLDRAIVAANQNPKGVAATLRADPKAWSVLSGMWKWMKEWAASSWEGTKAAFEGTGEFIGVGAAKLIHEWGDSFAQYAGEKLKPIGDMVQVAGEAIAITAAEAVHGDRSVLLWAVEYWKEKWVAFGKLPAEKQAELLSSFATQVALGVVGSKWLSAASKTATLSRTVNLADSAASAGKTLGKIADKAISGTAKAGAEIAGLDSWAMKPDARRTERAAVSAREQTAQARSGVSPETVRKNAALGDTERLAEAQKILVERGLLRPGSPLSEVQKAEILASHNAGKWVYENSASDLREKVRAGKQAAKLAETAEGTATPLSKPERRALMESGIMGSDQTALSPAKAPSAEALTKETIEKAKSAAGYSVEEMRNIIRSGDIQKQSDFLRKASPDEIGNALNSGLFDRFSDDFSAEFTRTVNDISEIHGKNKSNPGAVLGEIQRVIKSEGKNMSPDERQILDGIAKKMSGPGLETNFREGFKTVAKSEELADLVKNLPPSVLQAEGLAVLENAITRLAVSPQSQKNCVSAIAAFARKFPDSAKDGVLLMLEHTDTALWKETTLFEAKNLSFSVNGAEFEPMLQRMMLNNPEKFEMLSKEKFSWNYQLKGLEVAISRVKPFNARKFQDSFGMGPSREEAGQLLGKDAKAITDGDLDNLTDYNRLKSLLAEHPDTKFLDVSAIASRVGQENMDRFFHFSIPRLSKIAKGDAQLQGQIDRVLNFYKRDAFGRSRET